MTLTGSTHINGWEIKEIQQFINYRQQTINASKLRDLRCHDRVIWSGKAGYNTKGTITRVNRKTCSVDADDGTKWRVGVGMLTPIGKEV